MSIAHRIHTVLCFSLAVLKLRDREGQASGLFDGAEGARERLAGVEEGGREGAEGALNGGFARLVWRC